MARLSDRSCFIWLWIAQITSYCGRKSPKRWRIHHCYFEVYRSILSATPRQLVSRMKTRKTFFRGFRVLLALHKLKDKKENLGLFNFVMQGRSRQVKEPAGRASVCLMLYIERTYLSTIPFKIDVTIRRSTLCLVKLPLVHEPHLRLLSVVESVDRQKASV